jgi:hypothetical protein
MKRILIAFLYGGQEQVLDCSGKSVDPENPEQVILEGINGFSLEVNDKKYAVSSWTLPRKAIVWSADVLQIPADL